MVTSSLQLCHQTVTKSSYFTLSFLFFFAFFSSLFHLFTFHSPLPSHPYNPYIHSPTLIYKLCRNPRMSTTKRPVFPWLNGGVCFWWCWCCDYEKSSSNDGVRCDFGGMYPYPLYYICVWLVILVVDTECV